MQEFDLPAQRKPELDLPMRNEAWFRQLADSVPGMIYQFQMAADGSLSFTFVSSGCRDLFELTPEAIQENANQLIEIIHPEDRPRFDHSVALSAQSLEPWQWEGRFILPSGKIRWIQGASRPVRQPNQAILWSGQLMDISQRKQMEAILKQLNDDLETRVEDRTQALLESQAQFQRLASNIPGVIFQCKLGPDGVVSFPYISEGYRHIYELLASQLDQQPFQAIHPDDEAIVQERMYQSAMTLAPFQQEYRILTASGRLKWLQTIARPTRQVDGSILWDGVLIDITERKVAVEALQASESRFRELFERSADAILLLDGEVFIDCNKAAIEMLRCTSKEQVLQLHPSVLSPDVQPDGRPSFEKANEMIATAFAKGSHRFEWMHRRADGEDFWVEVVLTVIELEGRPTLYTVWREIGDRKAAETALAESEARFRTIAATMPGAIFQFCNRNGQWAVDYMSERFYDISGITAAEIMQDMNSFVNCQHPDDRDSYLQAIAESGEQLIPWVYEGRLIKPDGEVRWWRGESLPTKTQNNEIVFCGVLYDITNRKTAEDALKQFATQNQIKAKALEDALQELQRTQTQMIQSEKMSSLGQLVAGVAHEINNPVNFISGNLNHATNYIQDLLDLMQLYQQHYPTPDLEIQTTAAAIELEFLKQDLPKLLNSMKVGADRIQQIVTSLRTFSRMDEAERKAVNIHEGIDSTLLILQNRLKAKPHFPEILVIKEYDDLPLVECYAGQLNQVFMNILSNAIDALEEAQIPAPQIYIRTELLDPQWVRISILDNGPGISPVVHARIFDPFFTTKPIGKGTGMGMSISYQIITERHGGRLTCRSAPNQGAEFVIEIPVGQNI